jgi:hypothetical protein
MAMPGVAGCVPAFRVEPPASDLPRVASVKFSPSRVTTAYPIKVRIQFEDPGAGMRRVVGHWVRHRRHQVIAADYESVEVPPQTTGTAGAGEVTLGAHHRLPGWYEYHVYVEDAAGRKSNALTAGIPVDAQPLFPRAKCGEVRGGPSLRPAPATRTHGAEPDGVSGDVQTPTAVPASRGVR